tara:strand:+ start:559 stop:867 length:309 start_codon:yes stop_codon:yes gene_type:complete
MARNQIINGVVVDLTAEQETALEAQEKAWRDANPTPSELDYALINLRNRRNYLLAKTDWTANSDLVISDEMKAYRKKLRDATTGLDTVEKVEAYEFPTEVLK